jgi:PTH2 family peptidyl-tRNA hydrolase
MEPKQVIIIRTDTEPKMRKGKMIAQGAHASMKVIFDLMGNHHRVVPKMHPDDIERFVVYRELELRPDGALEKWIDGSFKKIVVGAPKKELVECYQEAKRQGILCALIEDKGWTEFKGEITITACAIGPALPEQIDPITGHLNLL